MNLQQIDRVTHLSKEEFLERYYKPQIPVVMERQVEDWPAFTKWNLDYIKELAGDRQVPLYDNRPVDHRDGFNQPHARMRLADYIDLLKREPTKYRIFLWNVLKEVPQLQEDFDFPDLGLPIMKSLPMLFFGGTNSYTFMHYDIDLGNIFHYHFEGKKECILFPQSQTPFLYKIPHSLITHESIDFSNPDLQQWPALNHVKGFHTNLKHGEVLYMPEGYWHYMRYLTPGFSMSHRAMTRNPKNLAKAIYNVVFMRYYDNVMRKIKGREWIEWKNKKAIERTHKLLEKGNVQ